jgi:Domain of unknown function (DUF6457)
MTDCSSWPPNQSIQASGLLLWGGNNVRSNFMTVDALAWITGFSEILGVSPPSETEIETLLAMAGVAAHASERIAAPVSCWLAAKANKSAEEALAAAETLASSLQ